MRFDTWIFILILLSLLQDIFVRYCVGFFHFPQRLSLFMILKQVLQRAACGMGLRAADPVAMKDFVVAVQQRTAELKASLSGNNNGKPVDLGKRVGLIVALTSSTFAILVFEYLVFFTV